MYRKNYSFILNIIPVKTTWNVGGMKGGGGTWRNNQKLQTVLARVKLHPQALQVFSLILVLLLLNFGVKWWPIFIKKKLVSKVNLI